MFNKKSEYKCCKYINHRAAKEIESHNAVWKSDVVKVNLRLRSARLKSSHEEKSKDSG